MSEYIVSARKYRPATFNEVVGQKALTTTLKNAVKSGKLAHAYLFCGPRGTGKTTCARIFAKAINCQSPTPEGEACGHCESCLSFNQQRSLNIFELDAASNNSVEHIKTLMEQTHIPPQIGKYKVFIIDEVHMLSTAAFNAFLKTLEEPPAHVIFILATTEKHKILPTILSRCQIYDFSRIGVEDIVAHLKMVAQKEGIACEDEALGVIAAKADGGMRDALSLFDQAASFCQGQTITYKKIIEDLNIPDADNYFQFVDLALDNDVKAMLLLLNQLLQEGFDAALLMSGLARHIRNVMMARDNATLPLIDASRQQRERYAQQASRCPECFFFRSLRLLSDCDVNYKQSANKRLLVELTLIEIGQLTQPDDDPVAGRKPRRLKSLFSNSVRHGRQPMAARQVAAATPEPHNADKNKTTLKTNLGFSWKNLKPGSSGANASHNTVGSATKGSADNPFTQDQLELQWFAMCNRLPQEYSGIASRMKNLTPLISNFPAIEVTADNNILADQIMPAMPLITSLLRDLLRNSGITLSLQVVQYNEAHKPLSRREIFETFANENPAVEKLRQLLGLELA